MASYERSPKRQRLSPSAETSGTITYTGDGADVPLSSVSKADGIDRDAVKPSHGSNESAPDITPTPIAEVLLVPSLSESASQASVAGPSDSAIKSQDVDVQMADNHRRMYHDRQDLLRPSTTEDLPLLCQKSHARSRPHPSQNLISLYSLSALAATVARRDPVTGAKINKLRKSYEGKVRKQELPGRNKPTVVPGELMGFMEWPDEGWYDQRVYGRELERALDPKRGRLFLDGDDEGGKSKLGRALALNVGRLPREEDEKWRAALALDEPAVALPTAPTPASLTTPVNGLKSTALATGMRASAPASPAGGLLRPADRPERAGRKRRYDDASFEGYDNGWAEDDGYSTGNDRSGSGRLGKRRRELEHAQTSAPTSANPTVAGAHGHGHFGSSPPGTNNMVGVRSS